MQDGGVVISDLEGALDARLTLPLPSHTAAACVAAAPAGRWLATAPSGQPLIHVWDVPQRRLGHALRVRSGAAVLQLAFCRGTNMLAALTDSALTLFDPLSGVTAARVAPPPRAPADCFALEPRGNYATIVASDGSLSFYDLAVARAAVQDAGGDAPAPFADRVPLSELPAGDDDDEHEDAENADSNARTVGNSKGGDNNTKQNNEGVIELPARAFDGLGQRFNLGKLKKLLNGYGEYPHRYRLAIWEFLLALPRNGEAAALLRGRGEHPAAAALMRRRAPRPPC
jgi:hypothetical protein